MPVKITKLGNKYKVSTPNGVHAKGTTKVKAEAQKRLLNAVDHGWKPTHKKNGGEVRKKMSRYNMGGEVESKLTKIDAPDTKIVVRKPEPKPDYYDTDITKTKIKAHIEKKSDGGEVEGEGTETSDSVPAKIRKRSFIIPAAIKDKLLKMLTSKPAKLNQNGGKDIMLSKGEQVVAPDDAEELDEEMKENGVKEGINKLAPKAKRKFNRKQFIKK